MSQEDAYQLYLQRFEAAGGKFAGAVVKKLSLEEFSTKWQDFVDIRNSYEAMLGRGLTVDNVLLRELRDRAKELVIELPPSMR
jgi:hypothetical protein